MFFNVIHFHVCRKLQSSIVVFSQVMLYVRCWLLFIDDCMSTVVIGDIAKMWREDSNLQEVSCCYLLYLS